MKKQTGSLVYKRWRVEHRAAVSTVGAKVKHHLGRETMTVRGWPRALGTQHLHLGVPTEVFIAYPNGFTGVELAENLVLDNARQQ